MNDERLVTSAIHAIERILEDLVCDDHHSHHHNKHHRKLHLTIGPVMEQDGLGLGEKPTMATFVLTDSQHATATIALEDKKGFPVALPDGESIAWSSSDESVVTVVPAADGLSADVVAGNPGTAQISIVADNGDGNPEAVATQDIQVVAGSLAQLAVSFGTPSEQ